MLKAFNENSFHKFYQTIYGYREQNINKLDDTSINHMFPCLGNSKLVKRTDLNRIWIDFHRKIELINNYKNVKNERNQVVNFRSNQHSMRPIPVKQQPTSIEESQKIKAFSQLAFGRPQSQREHGAGLSFWRLLDEKKASNSEDKDEH